MILRSTINRLFYALTRRLDGPLMVAIVVMAAMSVTIVFSASGGVSFDRALGQIRNFGVALVVMWVVANIGLALRTSTPEGTQWTWRSMGRIPTFVELVRQSIVVHLSIYHVLVNR